MKNIIKTTKEVVELCERLKAFSYVTVDTEFIRERTYWPQLCLIQIASKEEAVCIDPLAPGLDLTALFELFDDPKIVKVFHSARQDIEIFYNLAGRTPSPVFDTQIAAMVCGFGESISYQNLVYLLVGADVDKAMRFTDWRARPLDDRQIEYALGDVTHLRDVYEKLSEILAKTNRASWVEDETKTLLDNSLYENDPEEAWRKLKIRHSRPYVLANCKALAAFREKEAKRLDRPRKHILKDETIVDIASSAPQTQEQLLKMRGLPEGFVESSFGQEVLRIIQEVKEQDASTYPSLSRSTEMSRSSQALAKVLRLLLVVKAIENDVAERLIATLDEINILAKKEHPDVRALKGWRYEIFGKYALALKEGKLIVGYDPEQRKIKLTML